MPHVIVVGGGIGGLTAAVAFCRIGWRVSVYEATSEFRPVGKSIWLPTNAMIALDRLGLAESVTRAGWPLDAVQILTKAGKVLMSVDLVPVRSRYGHTTISLQRSALVELLAAGLSPGTVHFGRRFREFTQDADRVVARFEDGTEVGGDLLVGADGIRSAVREQLFPGVPLRYSGQSCYRGVTEMELPPGLARTCREVWGGRYRFGFSAIGPREVY